MNPAFRIWSFAVLFCLVFSVAISIINPGAAGFMMVIFLFVALASVVSLIGFFLLFEALKQVSTSRWFFWTGALLFVPVIVFVNAWLLMCVVDSGFHLGEDGARLELLEFAAIPLAATILSMLVSHRRINDFLMPDEILHQQL